MTERRHDANVAFNELRDGLSEVSAKLVSLKEDVWLRHNDNVKRIEVLEKSANEMPAMRIAINEMNSLIRAHTQSDLDALERITAELKRNTDATLKVESWVTTGRGITTGLDWMKRVILWMAAVAVGVATIYATVKWAMGTGPLPPFH